MGIIKKYIRKKLIAVIEFALREEVDNNAYFVEAPAKNDKQIESWTWDRFKRTDKQIESWTWDRFKRTDKQIEKWTWERFLRTQKLLEEYTNRIEALQRRIPYHSGEKIKLAILFQVPSFWASLSSFYEAVKNDERYEVTFLLYDAVQNEKAQMAGARDFLTELGIPFKDAEVYDFRMERPHILLYQTPYDNAHRPKFLQSDVIASLGIRIAYIPYGLHYSSSVWSDFVFSDLKFKVNPWFIAGLSEGLKKDFQYISNRCGHNVVVTGHPKFDLLYTKDENVKSSVLKEYANERKIIMVQMHFPEKEGNPHMPEPFIDEYLDFFKRAENYSELFFVIRPHPKFYETYEKYGYGEKVKEMQDVIEAGENLYLDQEKDYMNTLICADYYIGDRSSLMIEAAVLGIPVLYMTNFYYKEQMLPYVEELVESFYQGETCYDIERFIDLVILKGQDYKKEIRDAAVAECVPYFDGQCGKRIADAMVKVITIESET